MAIEQIKIEYPVERFYSIEELKDILPVTKSWVYKHTSQGDIPHHKFSGKLNFSKSDIEGIIKFCERNPVDPHNEAA